MCAPSTRSTRSTSKLFTKVMAAEGNCRKEVKVMNEQPLRRDAFVLLKKIPTTFEGLIDWGGGAYDDFVPGEGTKIAPSGVEST